MSGATHDSGHVFEEDQLAKTVQSRAVLTGLENAAWVAPMSSGGMKTSLHLPLPQQEVGKQQQDSRCNSGSAHGVIQAVVMGAEAMKGSWRLSAGTYT
jgi:hypothetical protein